MRQGFSVYLWLLIVSVCRPGFLWAHRDLPASASQVLGLKVYVTTPNYSLSFFLSYFKDSILLLFFPKPTYIFKHTVNCLEAFSSETIFSVSLFFLTTWVFNLLSDMARIKAVTLMAESGPFLSVFESLSSKQRY